MRLGNACHMFIDVHMHCGVWMQGVNYRWKFFSFLFSLFCFNGIGNGWKFSTPSDLPPVWMFMQCTTLCCTMLDMAFIWRMYIHFIGSIKLHCTLSVDVTENRLTILSTDALCVCIACVNAKVPKWIYLELLFLLASFWKQFVRWFVSIMHNVQMFVKINKRRFILVWLSFEMS